MKISLRSLYKCHLEDFLILDFLVRAGRNPKTVSLTGKKIKIQRKPKNFCKAFLFIFKRIMPRD